MSNILFLIPGPTSGFGMIDASGKCNKVNSLNLVSWRNTDFPRNFKSKTRTTTLWETLSWWKAELGHCMFIAIFFESVGNGVKNSHYLQLQTLLSNYDVFKSCLDSMAGGATGLLKISPVVYWTNKCKSRSLSDVDTKYVLLNYPKLLQCYSYTSVSRSKTIGKTIGKVSQVSLIHPYIQPHGGAKVLFKLNLNLSLPLIVYWWDVVPLLFRLQTNIFGRLTRSLDAQELLPLI